MDPETAQKYGELLSDDLVTLCKIANKLGIRITEVAVPLEVFLAFSKIESGDDPDFEAKARANALDKIPDGTTIRGYKV